MATAQEPKQLPVYGADHAPEHFIVEFGEIQQAGGNCLRFPLLSHRGDHMRVECFVLVPASAVPGLARRALQAALGMVSDLGMSYGQGSH